MPTGYSKNILTGALGVVGGLLSVVGCREKSEWDLESVCSANVTPDGSKVAKILLESGLCETSLAKSLESDLLPGSRDESAASLPCASVSSFVNRS